MTEIHTEMIDMVRRKRRLGKSVDSTKTPSKHVDKSIGNVGMDDDLIDALKQTKTVQNTVGNSDTNQKNIVDKPITTTTRPTSGKPTITPTVSPVDVGPAWDSKQAAKEAARMNDSIKKQPEFKQAQATKVFDQLSRGYKDPFIDESIKDALSPGLFIPRDKHLLVPVNVQAYVVPRDNSQVIAFPGQSKDKHNKNAQTVPSEETTTFHAPLGLDFRPMSEDDEELVWRIPNAFNREINGKDGGGLPPGIHLYWSMPRALLEGRAKEVEDPLGEFEYLETDLNVPENFISTDPRFEHPISFADAISHRVEFTTEEENADSDLNEDLEFPFLPDYWLVIRRSQPSQKNIAGNLRSWVIDAVSKEVTPLHSFSPSSRATNIPELTAVGPNAGDVHWLATYENVAGRFGFHDLPGVGEEGPFDYMVCGWYSDQTLDPAYMEATASENVWFKHIEQVLRWSVNRNNVDNDREVSYAHVDDHSMKKVVKSYEKKT